MGRICKEAVVPGGAEKNREKARMAGVPTEIPNRNFQNKNLAFYACNNLLGEMRKKLTVTHLFVYNNSLRHTFWGYCKTPISLVHRSV